METSARYILVGLFALIAIVAGFGFVYWLNNNGTVGERETYQIHFLGPVSGLQNGAAVQLNGIHVGEVTSLRLDDNNQVVATIAILKGMTLRADTGVSIDFQGLMGTALISLKGGSAKEPLLVPNPQNPPVLQADVGAGQDLTQTARGTLNRIDKILEDNAAPIKDTIGSLKTFSAALARNSNRVDTILAGLEKMTGGSPAEQPKPIYDLAIDAAGDSARACKGSIFGAGADCGARARYATDVDPLGQRPDRAVRQCAMERQHSEIAASEAGAGARAGRRRGAGDDAGPSRRRVRASTCHRLAKFCAHDWSPAKCRDRLLGEDHFGSRQDCRDPELSCCRASRRRGCRGERCRFQQGLIECCRQSHYLGRGGNLKADRG